MPQYPEIPCVTRVLLPVSSLLLMLLTLWLLTPLLLLWLYCSWALLWPHCVAGGGGWPRPSPHLARSVGGGGETTHSYTHTLSGPGEAAHSHWSEAACCRPLIGQDWPGLSFCRPQPRPVTIQSKFCWRPVSLLQRTKTNFKGIPKITKSLEFFNGGVKGVKFKSLQWPVFQAILIHRISPTNIPKNQSFYSTRFFNFIFNFLFHDTIIISIRFSLK